MSDTIDGPRGQIEILSVRGSFNMGSLTLNWSAKNCGFGQLYFYHDKERNRFRCSSECMGPNFIKLVLAKFAEECIIDDFYKEPEKIVTPITFEQLNVLLPVEKHYFDLPFSSKPIKDGFELRYSICDTDDIIVVWVQTNLEDSFRFESYKNDIGEWPEEGFVKAERWSWGEFKQLTREEFEAL